jgi:hypothetical protein
MIVCDSCGTENELGRVFCMQCGGKLDLSAMTSDVIAEQCKVGFFRKHWPKFAIGVVVLILAIVGLTFWPTGPIDGKTGTSVGGRRVNAGLYNMQRLAKGRAVAYTFKEADINGYFQYGKGKDLGLGAVTVKCYNGQMKIHMMTTMFNVKLFGFELSPNTTYDLVAAGYGGKLMVHKVTKGHLKVTRGSAKKFKAKLLEQNAFAPFKYATDIKIEEGKVVVTVSNK